MQRQQGLRPLQISFAELKTTAIIVVGITGFMYTVTAVLTLGEVWHWW